MAEKGEISEGHYGNLTEDQKIDLRSFWLTLYTRIAEEEEEILENLNRDDTSLSEINPEDSIDDAEHTTEADSESKSLADSESHTTGSSRKGRFFNLVKSRGKGKSKERTENSIEANPSVTTISKDLASVSITEDGKEIPNIEKLKKSKLLQELNFGLAHDIADRFALRFLRARKWDIDLAVDMTLETLAWRYEFNVSKIIRIGEDGLSEEELKSGKTYFTGKDHHDRPLIFVHACLHKKDPALAEYSQKYAIWLLETGRLLLEGNIEDVTIIMDLSNFSMSNMDYQGVKFLISSLQKHYPESLGKALIVNAPWIFSGCWAIIKHWLDPIVASKIQFIKVHELEEHMNKTEIPQKLGGDKEDWEYDCPSEKPHALPGGDDRFEAFYHGTINFHEANLKWCTYDEDAEISETPSVKEELKKLDDERTSKMIALSESFPSIVKHVRSETVFHRQKIIIEKGLNDE